MKHAIIKNWYLQSIISGEMVEPNNPTAVLGGDVYNHDMFVNGFHIHTSNIIGAEFPNIMITRNTKYFLEEVDTIYEKLFNNALNKAISYRMTEYYKNFVKKYYLV